MNDTIDRWQAADGSWLEMRPMRPDDEAGVKQSLNTLSAKARRNRFFGSIAEFSDAAVRRLVVVDLEKEYVLVVVRRAGEGEGEGEGEVPIAGGRFVEDDEQAECSFSLLIGDAWQGQGIGRRLLKALVREASLRGLRTMRGDVLADNRAMLQLARSLHFALADGEQGDGVVQIVRQLPDAASTRWRGFVRKVLRK
ncbi:GNAT family N-acetyltransferase [Candidatus Accumulibacter sp. ACC003]|uniref:GNAT family N-acetyltransferase n=1 Tax=Candidatus Accumulibacter sp. ACC003 TaxID=2823334 RepID=UPI0025C61B85|nr:GNAT family N-acetyltransferase [Candidatus Accumulibacter sp. ACC003]